LHKFAPEISKDDEILSIAMKKQFPVRLYFTLVKTPQNVVIATGDYICECNTICRRIAQIEVCIQELIEKIRK